MNTFPLQVLKINETVFEGNAVSLTAPGTAGELTVLPKHETMLTSLAPGQLCIRPENGAEECIEIQHGFLEATSSKVTVLL